MNQSTNLIKAFSAAHASRLTGLSPRQLANWDRIGFFRPEHACENRREAFSRLYSFQDIVGLRTLAILRKTHKIPLAHLRDVARTLEPMTLRPWSEITLHVLKKSVHFTEPETGRIRGVSDGQYVLLPLESVADDMRREADKLRARAPDKIGQIERHRNVAHNEWVVAGTRIPLRAIRQFADAGYGVADILREYPSLTEADVRVALSHAA